MKQTKKMNELLEKIKGYYNSEQVQTVEKKSTAKLNKVNNKINFVQILERKIDDYNNTMRKSVNHIKSELTKTEIFTNYEPKQRKLKICRQYFKTKLCRYGNSCPYAHKISELDVEYAPILWTQQFQKKKSLDNLSIRRAQSSRLPGLEKKTVAFVEIN
ncbi:hypothetical protein pb186bvf_019396 [Paramecium bursaria]